MFLVKIKFCATCGNGISWLDHPCDECGMLFCSRCIIKFRDEDGAPQWNCYACFKEKLNGRLKEIKEMSHYACPSCGEPLLLKFNLCPYCGAKQKHGKKGKIHGKDRGTSFFGKKN